MIQTIFQYISGELRSKGVPHTYHPSVEIIVVLPRHLRYGPNNTSLARRLDGLALVCYTINKDRASVVAVNRVRKYASMISATASKVILGGGPGEVVINISLSDPLFIHRLSEVSLSAISDMERVIKKDDELTDYMTMVRSERIPPPLDLPQVRLV